MTLLTISQNIAKTTKSDVPSTIIDNTEEIAKQIFEAVRLATKDVFERHDWSILNYDKTFSSVASQVQYDLPSDFDRIANGTFFNTTQRKEVFLTTPREWRQLNLNVGVSIIKRYRIRQNKVNLFPTPSAVESFTYEYISNLIITDNDLASTKTDWTKDNDTSLLNEDLIELQAIWRFLKFRGKDYAEEQQEAEDRLKDIMGRDAGRKTIYPDIPRYRFTNTFLQEITP
jgi:hypothetical protein